MQQQLCAPPAAVGCGAAMANNSSSINVMPVSDSNISTTNEDCLAAFCDMDEPEDLNVSCNST